LRVVADPAAIDAARWSGELDHLGRPTAPVTVLRVAPDEAFAIGARHVELHDGSAIIEDERGFVGLHAPLRAVGGAIAPHLEWPWPEPGAVAQGKVAGVPVKLLADSNDDTVWVVTHASYADELEERLGWR
jgi:hypothetical protein